MGPGSSSSGMPGRAQLGLQGVHALLVDVLDLEPEDAHVVEVPVRRHEHRDHLGERVAQQVGDGVLALGVLAAEVGEHLHAEADVALLVQGHVRHPSPEAGQPLVLVQVGVDEVLARLGERRLHEDVVHRDRGGQVGLRLVPPQRVGDPVEPLEGLAEAPGQLGLGGGECARVGAVAAADDLAHEAAEEHRVASLVDLLGGEEVLLLLERRGVDVGRQVVGDRVLAVEEQRVVPQGGLALELAPLLVPLDSILGEVDLRGAPVALLPPRVQVVVGDPVDCARDLRHPVLLRSLPLRATRYRGG